MRDDDYPVNIRQVTHHNKQFIPSFTEVGFAFRDISKTFASDSFKYNMKYYNKMIERLLDLAKKQFLGTKGLKECELTGEEEKMLFKICEYFAESNNKKIVSKIEKPVFLKVDGDGTHFHSDATAGIDYPIDSGEIVGVWIALSNIDNYPLVVGDARAYFEDDGVCNGEININDCAESGGFKDAVWYQQAMMTPSDAIFWNLKAVPHGSINLGQERSTKERFALNFQFLMHDTLKQS